jgi:hypothetical protein
MILSYQINPFRLKSIFYSGKNFDPGKGTSINSKHIVFKIFNKTISTRFV